MSQVPKNHLEDWLRMGFSEPQIRQAWSKSKDPNQVLEILCAGGSSNMIMEDDVQKAIDMSLFENKIEDRRRVDQVPVGLKNIGNTCYFNSLLQMYFYNSEFVKCVLKYQPPRDAPKYKKIHLSVQLVLNLQELFISLIGSDKKYVDPTNVIKFICDDLGTPLPIGDQKDLGEFNNFFLSRVEEGLQAGITKVEMQQSMIFEKNSQQMYSSQILSEQPIIRKIFFGKLSRQLFFMQNNLPQQTSTEDAFNFIPLDAKKKRFYDAMDFYVINGIDNYRNINNEVVSAQQYQWIKEAPGQLFFQIQRVDYNRIENSLSKLHETFEFDMEIYIDRFIDKNSRLYLEIRQKNQQHKQKQLEIEAQLKELNSYQGTDFQQSLTNAIQFFELQGKPSTSPLFFYPEKNLKEITQVTQKYLEALRLRKQALEYQYAELEKQIQSAYNQLKKEKYILQSILIHDGQANSGHYYAYILEFKSKTWFRYSDSIVTIESIDTIMQEAIGGNGLKSAYLLGYTRNDIAESEIKQIVPLRSFRTSDDQSKYLKDGYSQYLTQQQKDSIIRENRLFRQDIESAKQNRIIDSILAQYQQRLQFIQDLTQEFLQKYGSIQFKPPCTLNLPLFILTSADAQKLTNTAKWLILDCSVRCCHPQQYGLFDGKIEEQFINVLKTKLNNVIEQSKVPQPLQQWEHVQRTNLFQQYQQTLELGTLAAFCLMRLQKQDFYNLLPVLNTLLLVVDKNSDPKSYYYKLAYQLRNLTYLIFLTSQVDGPVNTQLLQMMIRLYQQKYLNQSHIWLVQIQIFLNDIGEKNPNIPVADILMNIENQIKSDNHYRMLVATIQVFIYMTQDFDSYRMACESAYQLATWSLCEREDYLFTAVYNCHCETLKLYKVSYATNQQYPLASIPPRENINIIVIIKSMLRKFSFKFCSDLILEQLQKATLKLPILKKYANELEPHHIDYLIHNSNDKCTSELVKVLKPDTTTYNQLRQILKNMGKKSGGTQIYYIDQLLQEMLSLKKFNETELIDLFCSLQSLGCENERLTESVRKINISNTQCLELLAAICNRNLYSLYREWDIISKIINKIQEIQKQFTIQEQCSIFNQIAKLQISYNYPYFKIPIVVYSIKKTLQAHLNSLTIDQINLIAEAYVYLPSKFRMDLIQNIQDNIIKNIQSISPIGILKYLSIIQRIQRSKYLINDVPQIQQFLAQNIHLLTLDEVCSINMNLPANKPLLDAIYAMQSDDTNVQYFLYSFNYPIKQTTPRTPLQLFRAYQMYKSEDLAQTLKLLATENPEQFFDELKNINDDSLAEYYKISINQLQNKFQIIFYSIISEELLNMQLKMQSKIQNQQQMAHFIDSFTLNKYTPIRVKFFLEVLSSNIKFVNANRLIAVLKLNDEIIKIIGFDELLFRKFLSLIIQVFERQRNISVIVTVIVLFENFGIRSEQFREFTIRVSEIFMKARKTDKILDVQLLSIMMRYNALDANQALKEYENHEYLQLHFKARIRALIAKPPELDIVLQDFNIKIITAMLSQPEIPEASKILELLQKNINCLTDRAYHQLVTSIKVKDCEKSLISFFSSLYPSLIKNLHFAEALEIIEVLNGQKVKSPIMYQTFQKFYNQQSIIKAEFRVRAFKILGEINILKDIVKDANQYQYYISDILVYLYRNLLNSPEYQGLVLQLIQSAKLSKADQQAFAQYGLIADFSEQDLMKVNFKAIQFNDHMYASYKIRYPNLDLPECNFPQAVKPNEQVLKYLDAMKVVHEQRVINNVHIEIFIPSRQLSVIVFQNNGVQNIARAKMLEKLSNVVQLNLREFQALKPLERIQYLIDMGICSFNESGNYQIQK